jgi:hypothetical protein
MQAFKTYIAQNLIGHYLHFKCDCLMKIDIEGKVVDYEMVNNEIVFIIDVGGRLIKLGENHPNLTVNAI